MHYVTLIADIARLVMSIASITTDCVTAVAAMAAVGIAIWSLYVAKKSLDENMRINRVNVNTSILNDIHKELINHDTLLALHDIKESELNNNKITSKEAAYILINLNAAELYYYLNPKKGINHKDLTVYRTTFLNNKKVEVVYKKFFKPKFRTISSSKFIEAVDEFYREKEKTDLIKMKHEDEVSNRFKKLVNTQSYRNQRQHYISLVSDALKTAQEVLDIGCGEGSLCRDIKSNVNTSIKITGIDKSASLIEFANTENGTDANIQYIQGEIPDELDKLKDCSYDVVFCCSMLKYLDHEQQLKTLQSIHRILKPNGKALIAESDDDSIAYYTPNLPLGRKVIQAYADHQGDPWCGRRLLGACRTAGFQTIQHKTYLMFEDEYNEEMAGYHMASNIHRELQTLAKGNKIALKKEQIDNWFLEIQNSTNGKKYYWSYPKIIYVLSK